ncbi:MAG: hypothetical protein GX580_13040 [Candidatus Hydrogenedens sp.]|jgi:hypothetical protein|nr:hypothetical protein [Candidatus Hydrogenedens sp.]
MTGLVRRRDGPRATREAQLERTEAPAFAIGAALRSIERMELLGAQLAHESAQTREALARAQACIVGVADYPYGREKEA